MKQEGSTLITISTLFLLGGVAPWILKQYHLHMATEIIIFSLFAVSYNLLLGYGGLLSFGHAMFFGIGGFMTAISLKHVPGITLVTASAISVFLTLTAGFLIGCLLLRTKGAYFALLTLAFNSLIYVLATKWHSITGGDDGLNIVRPSLSIGFTVIPVNQLTSFYYLTLIVIGSAMLLCWHLTRTAMGKTIILMRENEERMTFLGYSVYVTRLVLFSFTACLAGLAGSFYSLHIQFVSLSSINLEMSTAVLLMTFIGGTGSFWGPIIGVLVYIVLQDYLSSITERWAIVMGLIFIFMVLFMPGGLSKAFLNMWRRLGGGSNRARQREIPGADGAEAETL